VGTASSKRSVRISMCVELTHIDEVRPEPLLQVLQKGILALVVLQQNGVLDPDMIPLVQRTLHVRAAFFVKIAPLQ
jgi:hypothetical protein